MTGTKRDLLPVRKTHYFIKEQLDSNFVVEALIIYISLTSQVSNDFPYFKMTAFLDFIIYLLLEKGGEGEKEKKRNVNGRDTLHTHRPGIEPTTQACACPDWGLKW